MADDQQRDDQGNADRCHHDGPARFIAPAHPAVHKEFDPHHKEADGADDQRNAAENGATAAEDQSDRKSVV